MQILLLGAKTVVLVVFGANIIVYTARFLEMALVGTYERERKVADLLYKFYEFADWFVRSVFDLVPAECLEVLLEWFCSWSVCCPLAF